MVPVQYRGKTQATYARKGPAPAPKTPAGPAWLKNLSKTLKDLSSKLSSLVETRPQGRGTPSWLNTALKGMARMPAGMAASNQFQGTSRTPAWPSRYGNYYSFVPSVPRQRPSEMGGTFKPYPAQRPTEAGTTAAIRAKIPGWRGMPEYVTPPPYAPKPQPVLHYPPEEPYYPETAYQAPGYGRGYSEPQFTYPPGYTGPAEYQRYRGQVPYGNNVPRWLQGLVTWRF